MTPVPEPRSPALPELAGEIRREIERAELAWQDAVGHAIRAGELLIEAKAQVKHGEWLPWLAANFPGSERSARNYMRLAANRQTVADLPTVREAVAALTTPRAPRELPTRGQAGAIFEAVAGWFDDALEAIDAGDPLAPEMELPEDPDDDLAMARFWIGVAERCSVATRRAGRRALAIAARSEGAAAAIHARAGAAGLALAEAEPYEDGYEQLHEEWRTAVHGLGPMVEREPEVVQVILRELVRVHAERNGDREEV